MPDRQYPVKRLIAFSILALTLIVLALWGDSIAGRILDAQLAPLLSRKLGLPVKLEPIQARLLKLTASSPKLIMGNPQDPAVVAQNVEVKLALTDLLRGEVRLVAAYARDLMVRPAKWPVSEDPLPENYLFLDQWLPRNLRLEKGRYMSATGHPYPVRQFHWRRKIGGGVSLDWSEDRAAGQIDLSASLDALEDLLQLKPLAVQLVMQLAGKQDSTVTLNAAIKPGESGGYIMDNRIQAGGMTGHVVTGNEHNWQIPASSKTTIDTLELAKLRKLVGHYTTSDEEGEPKPVVPSALSALSLPQHQGSVTIGEVRLNDEVARDNRFNFTTSQQGVKVSSLVSNGPAGTLHGGFDVVTDEQGWKVKLNADITVRETGSGTAEHFLDSDWLWQAGHARLDGQGSTWSALLNSLEGDINLEGFHRGKARTPIKMTARLGNRPGEFTLEEMNIGVGGGHITGSLSLSLSGETAKTLAMDIKAEQLKLDFLFEEESTESQPGLAEPTFLTALPGVDLNFKIDAQNVHLPNLHVAQATVSLLRSARHTELTARATGMEGGRLDLNLDALVKRDVPSEVTLSARLEKFNIPRLFQEKVLFHSRTSGSIIFQSRGTSVKEAFSAMRGKADLTMDFRADNDWQRASSDFEQLSFSGDAGLVVKDGHILGLEISNLDVGSTEQDLSGSISIVTQRTPWVIADLKSEQLDIQGIRALLPKSTDKADKSDWLGAIRKFGSMRLSLDAKAVALENAPLSEIKLEVYSAPDRISIKHLDFRLERSPFKSRAELAWRGEKASFKASASISDFDLDRFVIKDPATPHVPVSGELSLESEGSKFSELLANLSGHVDLAASREQPGASLKSRRKLAMQVKRLPDGMHADISSLQWGENELAGNLRYYKSTPPLLEVKLEGGSLSLEPWEKLTDPKEKASEQGDSAMTRAARTSAGFVGSILRAPAALIAGPAQAKPGNRMFKSDPLPFAVLGTYNAKIQGRVDSLTTRESVMKDLDLNATLTNGQLSAKFKAGSLNSGSAQAQIDIDSTGALPAVKLEVSFDKIMTRSGEPTYPRSGFASLHSQGNSEAELAANLSGQAVLELGQGPADYQSMTFLNADVATRMFRTLIPGLDRSQPDLECGLALFNFEKGAGITPYGYAVRTQSANLIGRIKLDLKKEMIRLEFDSRSHEGVGISVGSVFSNTVRIEGPLTNPQIVPRTTSILWRGWAAFMTAGLSVVGESVLKRALASANPCEAIRQQIQKDLCGTDQPAASSPLVCPGAGGQAAKAPAPAWQRRCSTGDAPWTSWPPLSQVLSGHCLYSSAGAYAPPAWWPDRRAGYCSHS